MQFEQLEQGIIASMNMRSSSPPRLSGYRLGVPKSYGNGRSLGRISCRNTHDHQNSRFHQTERSMPLLARNWIHFYTAYVQDDKLGRKMAGKMFLDEFYKHIADFNP